MSRTALELAARTRRNRLAAGLAIGVLVWCIASPLPAALVGNLGGLPDVVRWHWWLPVAAYVAAVALNLPTPHVPADLVRKLDQPDALRVGRGALFGYGLGAAAVVMIESIAITYDDPWLAVFGPGPLPAVEPATWVLLTAAAVVALRSLAGTLGWVPAAWREVTEDDFRARRPQGRR